MHRLDLFRTAVVLVVGVAVGLALTTVIRPADLASMPIGAPQTPGCETLEGTIEESTEFVPWESQRSQLPDLPISTLGAAVTSAPSSSLVREPQLDGLGIRWSVSADGGPFYLYFFDRAIPADMTTTRFFAEGGLLFTQDLYVESRSLAELEALMKARSNDVLVGEHAGILGWADPLADGTRTHNLLWSDGDWSYSLIGDRSAVDIVNIARSLACA